MTGTKPASVPKLDAMEGIAWEKWKSEVIELKMTSEGRMVEEAAGILRKAHPKLNKPWLNKFNNRSGNGSKKREPQMVRAVLHKFEHLPGRVRITYGIERVY